MLIKIFIMLKNFIVLSLLKIWRYLFVNSPKDNANDSADDAATKKSLKKKSFFAKILYPEGGIGKKIVLVFLMMILLFEGFSFFDPLTNALDNQNFALTLGTTSISFYGLFKTILWMILLLWVAGNATHILKKQLEKMQLPPARHTLIYKVLQIAIYVAIFLIAMKVLGISLTSLAIFSGALGIGIGFGMQKITANLISGFILTVEGSLVPGTLIELSDGRVGYIRHISVRYTLLEAADGLEILIPNEELVTNKLINWTLNNTEVRGTIDIGVSYGSDMDLVQKLLLQAVQENNKIAPSKPPAVHMKDFGDNAVIFEIIYWVADVTQHWKDVRSDILFSIWQKFESNNIQIPYPQLDLHMIGNQTPAVNKTISAKKAVAGKKTVNQDSSSNLGISE